MVELTDDILITRSITILIENKKCHPFLRISVLKRRSKPGFRVSHPQTMAAFQPSFRSSLRTILSRLIFESSLASQNWTFETGRAARLQRGCPCQKQPWTNMTSLRPGITMSGLPGRLFSCNRTRKPEARRRLRTVISGVVFLLPTFAMQR